MFVTPANGPERPTYMVASPFSRTDESTDETSPSVDDASHEKPEYRQMAI